MHAEALPTDWMELAREMRALSEAPGISAERRELYLRAAMHYEVEALAAHFRDPSVGPGPIRDPMRMEDLP